jgi:hypothetical protein
MNDSDYALVKLISYDIDEETGLIIWELAEYENNQEKNKQKVSYRLQDILSAFHINIKAKDIPLFFNMLIKRKEPFKWIRNYIPETKINKDSNSIDLDKVWNDMYEFPYAETEEYLKKKGL